MKFKNLTKIKESDLIDSVYEEEYDSDSSIETDKLLPPENPDIGTIVAQTEKIIQDPALQYDPKKDPEITGEFVESKALWKGYMKNHKRLVETTEKDVINYISNFCNGDPDLFDLQDFAKKFPSKMHDYWAKHADRFFKDKLPPILDKMGLESDAVASENSDSKNPIIPDSIDYSKLGEYAQDMLAETQELDAVGALNDVMSLEDAVEAKYDNVYLAAANIINGRSLKKFALICGDAGVGKSYAVNQAIVNVWPKSPLKSKGWTLNKIRGSIGTAITNIVVFFFTHRNNEIIIMDDADGFLLSKSQDVQNLLKGLLDSDNTPEHPQPVHISPTIAGMATSWLGGAKKRESVTFSIDKEKLQENILSVAINGETIVESMITDEEKSMFGISLKESSYDRYSNPVKGLSLFKEKSYNDDEEEFDEDDEDDLDDVELEVDTDELVVPTDWEFSSRMIMISNLTKENLNDAVASRCDVVSLHLEPDEFSFRLKQILPNMMQDFSATEVEPDLIKYAKNTSYGLFNGVIEMAEQGIAPYGVRVRVNPKVLQFRIVPELTGGWIRMADAWLSKWNREHPGNEISPTPDNYSRIAANIKKKFILKTLLPMLAEGLPGATKVSKKSYIG